jgi:hypothetical protein
MTCTVVIASSYEMPMFCSHPHLNAFSEVHSRVDAESAATIEADVERPVSNLFRIMLVHSMLIRLRPGGPEGKWNGMPIPKRVSPGCRRY